MSDGREMLPYKPDAEERDADKRIPAENAGRGGSDRDVPENAVS